MKSELIFYRMSILLFICAVVGGGTLAAYNKLQQYEWNGSVQSNYERLTSTISDCEKQPNRSACEFVAIWEENFDRAVEYRDMHEEDSAFWMNVALFAPIAIILTFYLLRWMITGKIRPFFVSTNDTKETNTKPAQVNTNSRGTNKSNIPVSIMKYLISCVLYAVVSHVSLSISYPGFNIIETALRSLLIYSILFTGYSAIPILVAILIGKIPKINRNKPFSNYFNGGLAVAWVISLLFLYGGWYAQKSVS